jgi:membrane fusion protein, multidrug efflux system
MNRLVLLAVLLAAGCSQAPPGPPAPPVVGTVQAAPAASMLSAITYVGTLTGEIEVDLAFKLPGRVERIGPGGRDWREGDAIAAGQVAAALDPVELRETMRATEARAANDAALYERGSRLMADKLISQQDLDRLTASRDASAADLRKAQAALGDAVLNAPFAGTVLRRHVRAGETIAAGIPVLRIADLTRLSVDLGVPEQVVTRLKPGQELAMTVSAFAGAPFAGTVSEVGASAASGTRLFRVRIALPNPDGRLRPGMSASVAIPGDPPPDGAVTVPLSALLADPEGRRFHVFVIDADGIARARPVEVADVVASSAVIGRGLDPGDRIVASGAGLCADGLRVDARNLDPDALYRR